MTAKRSAAPATPPAAPPAAPAAAPAAAPNKIQLIRFTAFNGDGTNPQVRVFAAHRFIYAYPGLPLTPASDPEDVTPRCHALFMVADKRVGFQIHESLEDFIARIGDVV